MASPQKALKLAEELAPLIGAFKDIFPRIVQCPNERYGDRVHKHALALSYAQG